MHVSSRSETLITCLAGTAIIGQAGIWILAAIVWAAVFEAEHFTFLSVHPVCYSRLVVAAADDA